jgi:hypothetical protein
MSSTACQYAYKPIRACCMATWNNLHMQAAQVSYMLLDSVIHPSKGGAVLYHGTAVHM